MDILVKAPVTTSSGGSANFPVVTADPVSPADGDAWILESNVDLAGKPLGLLLALTHSPLCELKIKTASCGTRRINLLSFPT